MKWSRHFFMVCLFLLLFLAYSGFSWGETTSAPLNKLQSKYQTLTNKLNRLVILSEQDMITLQSQLPSLILEVQTLKTSVTTLQTEAANLKVQATGLKQDLTALERQLTELKIEIDKLSASLESLEKQMTIFTTELNQMKRRNETGLIVSVTALLVSIGIAFHDILKSK